MFAVEKLVLWSGVAEINTSKYWPSEFLNGWQITL